MRKGVTKKRILKQLGKGVSLFMSVVMLFGVLPGRITVKAADGNEETKQDIEVELPDVIKGKSVELPKKCTYYDEEGKRVEDADVTFTLDTPEYDPDWCKMSEEEFYKLFPKMEDGKLYVPDTYTSCYGMITATCNDYSKEIYYTILEDEGYNINVYYCDPYSDSRDNEVDVAAYDVALKDYVNSDEKLTSELEEKKKLTKHTLLYEQDYDKENDITWNKGVLSTKMTNLYIEFWDHGKTSMDTVDLTELVKEGKQDITLYYVDGKGFYFSKPSVTKIAPKHILVEYERKDNNYDGWELESDDAYNHDTINFKNINGKMVANLMIPANKEEVGFGCIKKDEDDSFIDYDGYTYIDVPKDQDVIYYKFTQDSDRASLKYPLNTGVKVNPMDKSIDFFYRDDPLFLSNQENQLEGKVQVCINGTTYDMTYDEATCRYTYSYKNATAGKYAYYYIVNGNKVLDRYAENSDADYSYINFYDFNAVIQPSFNMKEMNYNQNAVLSVSVAGLNDTEKNHFMIDSMYADLSQVGGESQVAIDKELMALTISVKDTVPAGKKVIPVTVIDNYGKKFVENAEINVVARDDKNGDFDWDEASIYFMMTDRFYDGNPSNNTASGADTYGDNPGLYHGGDFAGVTQKLDYLKDLGINTIWISPIVDNIKGVKGNTKVPFVASFHGYWAQDFKSLEPTFGTPEEFGTLVDEAHQRGIKIMVDVVLNHRGYFESDNGVISFGEFSDMIRHYDEDNDIQSWLYGLPDFITEDKEVRDKIIGWQTAWMKQYPIDYFRVDTVNNVDLTTWSDFKNQLAEINPNFKLLGEAFEAGYNRNNATLNSGRMDSLLDFDMNDMAQNFVSGKLTEVEDFMKNRNASINNTACMGSFLDSHDEDGLQYLLSKKYGKEEAGNLMKLAASLQITAKGQPVIYYGEEVGLTGPHDYPIQSNRYDFDWSLVNDSNTMYTHYKKLLNIRKNYSKVFAKGTRSVYTTNEAEGYDVISRNYNDENIVVGFNITNDQKEAAIQTQYEAGTKLYDVYNGYAYTVGDNGSVKFVIPGSSNGGTAILSTENRVGIEIQSPQQADNKKIIDQNVITDQRPDAANSTAAEQGNKTGNDPVKTGDDMNRILVLGSIFISTAFISAKFMRKRKYIQK